MEHPPQHVFPTDTIPEETYRIEKANDTIHEETYGI